MNLRQIAEFARTIADEEDLLEAWFYYVLMSRQVERDQRNETPPPEDTQHRLMKLSPVASEVIEGVLNQRTLPEMINILKETADLEDAELERKLLAFCELANEISDELQKRGYEEPNFMKYFESPGTTS